MTGIEMASLIRILVEAANNGSIASMPLRLDSFVSNLMEQAINQCAEYYLGDASEELLTLEDIQVVIDSRILSSLIRILKYYLRFFLT